MYIRPARKTDAQDALPLIYQVISGFSGTLLGSRTEQEFHEVIADFFQAENNRFSYQNYLVAEVGQRVAGLLLLYHGRDAEVLDRPILEHARRVKNNPTFRLDKEADEDEWYIDTLSVSPDYAGQGIGTALMKAAEEQVRQRQDRKLALLVEEENTRAHRLYQHLGYKEDKKTMLYGISLLHMVKFLA
ncbi:GNAT family N-acetyltransferase [Dictyobacter arantiisoli]|uniref:N-acetyltransferase n=1 Tax=Dictyobacter arantiisoli TaxID=2014874 RepID=A0A5A5TAN7_9CHLR|nr:GNAT family N-acetyltransferase [Dictyobacter arantiisoli]GCF08315.1 N-acetyltransferase [Dictyobacter arantiisoli]